MIDYLYTLLLLIFVVGVALTILKLRNNNVKIDQMNDIDILVHLKKHGGNEVSHLFFQNDKDVFWSDNHNVLIVYRKIFHYVIVLGDPIGIEEDIYSAMSEFEMFAHKNGLRPIYYQVNPLYYNHYYNLGYKLFKLGEIGKVALSQFTLEGKRVSKLRSSNNKFIREGYTFEILNPPYSAKLLSDIREVSDSWLNGRKEKGFSVSSYDETYISRFPLAIIRNDRSESIAFASLASDFGKEQKTISIDLMRTRTDSPSGTMDVLFIRIFNWSKENGFDYCSLGMSPLSNVGQSPFSAIKEKMAHFVYNHGSFFYNFKGLRAYKNKFAHQWDAKYLAYKRTPFPFVILSLIVAVNYKPLQVKSRLKKMYYRLKKVV